MKLKNALLLPITIAADAVTLGTLGITKAHIQSDCFERVVETLAEINKKDNLPGGE